MPTAAQWLIFGMVSGRVIYFANEAEWNWLDYFEAYLGDGAGGGLDMKWTEELAADFQSREGMGEEGTYDFEEFNWEVVSSCEVGNCTEVNRCSRGDTCPERERQGAVSIHPPHNKLSLFKIVCFKSRSFSPRIIELYIYIFSTQFHPRSNLNLERKRVSRACE